MAMGQEKNTGKAISPGTEMIENTRLDPRSNVTAKKEQKAVAIQNSHQRLFRAPWA